MEGAEDGVECVFVSRGGFEDEDAVFDVLEVFAGFVEEFLEELHVVGIHDEGVFIFDDGGFVRRCRGEGGGNRMFVWGFDFFGLEREGGVVFEVLEVFKPVVHVADVWLGEGSEAVEDAVHVCGGVVGAEMELLEVWNVGGEVADVAEEFADGQLVFVGAGFGAD